MLRGNRRITGSPPWCILTAAPPTGQSSAGICPQLKERFRGISGRLGTRVVGVERTVASEDWSGRLGGYTRSASEVVAGLGGCPEVLREPLVPGWFIALPDAGIGDRDPMTHAQQQPPDQKPQIHSSTCQPQHRASNRASGTYHPSQHQRPHPDQATTWGQHHAGRPGNPPSSRRGTRGPRGGPAPAPATRPRPWAQRRSPRPAPAGSRARASSSIAPPTVAKPDGPAGGPVEAGYGRQQRQRASHRRPMLSWVAACSWLAGARLVAQSCMVLHRCWIRHQTKSAHLRDRSPPSRSWPPAVCYT